MCSSCYAAMWGEMVAEKVATSSAGYNDPLAHCFFFFFLPTQGNLLLASIPKLL